MVVVNRAACDAVFGVCWHGAGVPIAGIQLILGLGVSRLPQPVDDMSIQGHGDSGRVGAGIGAVVPSQTSGR